MVHKKVPHVHVRAYQVHAAGREFADMALRSLQRSQLHARQAMASTHSSKQRSATHCGHCSCRDTFVAGSRHSCMRRTLPTCRHTWRTSRVSILYEGRACHNSML